RPSSRGKVSSSGRLPRSPRWRTTSSPTSTADTAAPPTARAKRRSARRSRPAPRPKKKALLQRLTALLFSFFCLLSSSSEHPAHAERRLPRALAPRRRLEGDAAGARIASLHGGHGVGVEQVDRVGVDAEPVALHLERLLHPEVDLVDELVPPR